MGCQMHATRSKTIHEYFETAFIPRLTNKPYIYIYETNRNYNCVKAGATCLELKENIGEEIIACLARFPQRYFFDFGVRASSIGM